MAMGPSPCRSREAQWPLLEQGDGGRNASWQMHEPWKALPPVPGQEPTLARKAWWHSEGSKWTLETCQDPYLNTWYKSSLSFIFFLILKVLSKIKTKLYMFFIGTLNNLAWQKGLGFNIFIIKNIDQKS